MPLHHRLLSHHIGLPPPPAEPPKASFSACSTVEPPLQYPALLAPAATPPASQPPVLGDPTPTPPAPSQAPRVDHQESLPLPPRLHASAPCQHFIPLSFQSPSPFPLLPPSALPFHALLHPSLP